MSKLKNPVKLKVYTTRVDAELAKGYLESNGITVDILVDDELGSYPYPMTLSLSGVHMFVSKKDEAAAKKLLERVK